MRSLWLGLIYSTCIFAWHKLDLEALGIPTAPGKAFGPSQIPQFLDIELDSNLMEARLPQDKVEKMR